MHRKKQKVKKRTQKVLHLPRFKPFTSWFSGVRSTTALLPPPKMQRKTFFSNLAPNMLAVIWWKVVLIRETAFPAKKDLTQCLPPPVLINGAFPRMAELLIWLDWTSITFYILWEPGAALGKKITRNCVILHQQPVVMNTQESKSICLEALCFSVKVAFPNQAN